MKKPIDDAEYIYRASVRTKSGKIIYAASYGLKAFKIRKRY